MRAVNEKVDEDRGHVESFGLDMGVLHCRYCGQEHDREQGKGIGRKEYY
jgi:hypothetical protein